MMLGLSKTAVVPRIRRNSDARGIKSGNFFLWQPADEKTKPDTAPQVQLGLRDRC
jgi:hypothetical protein